MPQHWPTFSETKTSTPLPKVWKELCAPTSSTSGKGSNAAFITWFIWRLPAPDDELDDEGAEGDVWATKSELLEAPIPPVPPKPPNPAEDDPEATLELDPGETLSEAGSARLASILDTRAGLGAL